jgi:Dyp-type peroxidase family
MSLLQIEDIQGIILYGYGKLASACFVLLRISDPQRTKAWLKTLDIRNGESRPEEPERCVNIAFTHAGLKKLGPPATMMQLFSGEFSEGMSATERRQRNLGDVGESNPERWSWGGPKTAKPHILLMLYGRNDDTLASLLSEQQSGFPNAGLEQIIYLGTKRLPFGKEHFGFSDGGAQPGIEGFHTDAPAHNLIAAGEFILGYPNAYGQYTPRPLAPKLFDRTGILPVAPDDSTQCDLGTNGSYLVFRQLRQDVAAFWKFIDDSTRRKDGASDPEARLTLASKMVGRWPSGAPLVKAPNGDNPALAKDNDFLYYGSDDSHGFKCPIGAHIRRTNPRDSLDPEPGSARSIEIGKRHRILRRGRTYGEPVVDTLEPSDILATDNVSGERGLHFLCFNSHIERQFEFIQHTWVNSPKFDGLYEDDDPLIGDRNGEGRKPGGCFTMQAYPIRTRVTGIPRFVHVRGGAYFFMPGIRAVRFLGSLP